MANCSDAFGNIIVKKVGKEFVKYITAVQDNDSYYMLIDNPDLLLEKPDEDGDAIFGFSTSGRWAYENNLDGYLNGEWMDAESGKEKEYKKFVAALKKKGGSVRVEYDDSDTSMDWMGSGYAELSVEDGEVCYSKDFISEELTIENFARQQMGSDEWALGYLYGEEVRDAYEDYVNEWKKTHDFIEGREEPACPSEWHINEYRETEEYV